MSESLHTPTKQSAELKFDDSHVTDDELLAFESQCGSNNIFLDEEANDQISLGQAFKQVKDDSKENDSKGKGKCGEGNISKLSNQSPDKEFVCNENDACIQDSDGHEGGGYTGEGYKEKLHFEGDSVDSNGKKNDNASKGLDDDSNT